MAYQGYKAKTCSEWKGNFGNLLVLRYSTTNYQMSNNTGLMLFCSLMLDTNIHHFQNQTEFLLACLLDHVLQLFRAYSYLCLSKISYHNKHLYKESCLNYCWPYCLLFPNEKNYSLDSVYLFASFEYYLNVRILTEFDYFECKHSILIKICAIFQ